MAPMLGRLLGFVTDALGLERGQWGPPLATALLVLLGIVYLSIEIDFRKRKSDSLTDGEDPPPADSDSNQD